MMRAACRRASVAHKGLRAAAPLARRFQHAEIEGLGNHVFKGAVANAYLAKQGLPPGTLNSPAWTANPATADKVAAAIMDWATANGARVFCHWFQPLASEGMRHGQTGMVQNTFFKFDSEGHPVWDLKGKDLLQGETDGSSYNNGGLRATNTAGGYLSIDTTSPIFLRGDTIFIPACFVSYYGHALDQKTSLLRSCDALDKEVSRMLKLMGYNVPGVESRIGLEQEFFFVPRAAFLRRPDLQLCGRTLIGKDAPRGQEMCDHYMGSPSYVAPPLACMQEIQDTCYKMGIPLLTRHREVAPNQFEFAPRFGSVTTQIDQNLVVMQVIEEVAAKHGLAALHAEKPFANINGSGKHNNWSIGTTDGVNLLNAAEVTEVSGNADIFPVIMSAIVSAIDTHGDLMRCSIACPGNDFRLGACEAPPAIVSTYLGESLTTYLEGYKGGKAGAYAPKKVELNLGPKSVPPIKIPSEDRNRTSPFPYGGHRFEFRAVGSSQNVSLVNTVLNVMTADACKNFSDQIEGGKAPQAVAADALGKAWKCIFNGDNYDLAEQEMLTKRGVWRIDSSVESMCKLSAEKNTKMFAAHNVMSKEECEARQTTLLDQYTGIVELEALTFVDLLNQHVIPSVKAAGVGPLKEIQAAVGTVQGALKEIHAADSSEKKATLARTLRLETMVDLRVHVDAAEAVCPANLWTLATYTDLLFLDYTA